MLFDLAAPVPYHLLASLSYIIALAYIVIGFYVVPSLRLYKWARIFGSLFFVTCAGTHIELGIHVVGDQPDWALSAHMWIIHSVQAFVDWAFIIATRPWERIRVRIVFDEHKEDAHIAGGAAIVDESADPVKYEDS